MALTHAAVLYLDRPREPYFKTKSWEFARERGVTALGVTSGRELCDAAAKHADKSVDHLFVGAHGGSRWLLSSKHGVSVTRTNSGPKQVTAGDFTDAWGPKLVPRPGVARVTFAACLCSRSPHWYLKTYFGRLLSAWGPRSYQSGGEASFSSAVRDNLILDFDLEPDVRGHASEGDMVYNALVRRHTAPLYSPGVTLFQLALPGVEPIGPVRRRWTRKPDKGGIVRGERARRFLVHDDSVIAEIRELWYA